jgi:hypothetical protein
LQLHFLNQCVRELEAQLAESRAFNSQQQQKHDETLQQQQQQQHHHHSQEVQSLKQKLDLATAAAASFETELAAARSQSAETEAKASAATCHPPERFGAQVTASTQAQAHFIAASHARREEVAAKAQLQVPYGRC